ncbi:hypothetical protein Tco_1335501 [Tanacetum coccineum]
MLNGSQQKKGCVTSYVQLFNGKLRWSNLEIRCLCSCSGVRCGVVGGKDFSNCAMGESSPLIHYQLQSLLGRGIREMLHCPILEAVGPLFSDERVVWLDIEGVPLYAWSRKSFDKIGDKINKSNLNDLKEDEDMDFVQKAKSDGRLKVTRTQVISWNLTETFLTSHPWCVLLMERGATDPILVKKLLQITYEARFKSNKG